MGEADRTKPKQIRVAQEKNVAFNNLSKKFAHRVSPELSLRKYLLADNLDHLYLEAFEMERWSRELLFKIIIALSESMNLVKRKAQLFVRYLISRVFFYHQCL